MTALFGKWHNGAQAPYHPLCRGFDEFYGFTSGNWGHYDGFWIDHNGEPTKGTGYLPDVLTDWAILFIDGADEQPFFVVVAFNTPHPPMHAPARWWELHPDQTLGLRGTAADREDPPHTRAALAMVENLD